MGLFDAIGIAGSGLTAERIRMDVTAENLANADTTKAANGKPYQRQEVELAQVGSSDFGGALSFFAAGGAAAVYTGGVRDLRPCTSMISLDGFGRKNAE